MTDFNAGRRGGLVVDRNSLHISEGYKRQVAALQKLNEAKAMTDKTMTEVRDWHLDAYKVTGQPKHKDMADAITRHLSQTAERGEAVAWQRRDLGHPHPQLGTKQWSHWREIGLHEFNHMRDYKIENPARTDIEVRPLYNAPPPAAGVPGAASFAAWLIDHGEGETVTEEGLQQWLADWISATPSPAIDAQHNSAREGE